MLRDSNQNLRTIAYAIACKVVSIFLDTYEIMEM
jgi:hypothetical protein